MTQERYQAEANRLSRALVQNLHAFTLNNRSRVKELQRYGSYGLRTVFQKAPFLLQINLPDQPGYIEVDNAPRGIHGFSQTEFVKPALESFVGPRIVFDRAITVIRPVVDSLLLMGSTGSVGHTATSDLDYWVCVDQTNFTEESWLAFGRKLDLITEWALEAHHTEVHFYRVELADLASNRMKAHGAETEGEVAPLLLKEELYRTLVHVAGRIPLWWAVPPGIGLDQYRKIQGFLDRAVKQGRMPERFIDLGFPMPPDPQEYLAAALWLSQKSEADPFKGVLKMILIQDQVESKLSRPLLCDEVKEAVLTAGEEDLPVDPYVMTIKRVRDYSRDRFDAKSLALVRMSIFFKIRGALYTSRSAPDSHKARYIQDLIQDWGWDETQVEHLKNYASWPEREKLTLGQEVKALLFTLYSHIARRLMDDYPDQVSAGEQSLARLKARILSRYSDHQAKVEDLPSSQHRETLPKTLSMIYNLGRWELYGGWVEAWQVGTDQTYGRLIYECSRAARLAAWLVHNRLWSTSLKLMLRPRPGPVSLETMIELMELLSRLFPLKEAEAPNGEENATPSRKGPRVLIVNLEEAWHERRIESVDLVYRMPWGEIRHSALDLSEFPDEVGKYLAMAEMILENGEVNFEDVHLFVPEGLFGQKVKRNMRAVFGQVVSGQRRGLVEAAAHAGKSALDTD